MGWFSRWWRRGEPQTAADSRAALGGVGDTGLPARGAAAAPAVPRQPGAQPPAAAAPAAAATPDTAASGPPLLCWLLDAPAPAPSLAAHEARALDTLDRILDQDSLPGELLPRAANVVPQLIAMLRQDDLPVAALAERIAKDPPLAAEVLRMAGTAFFVGGRSPAQDLPQAIQVLGIEGLHMAISRVLLRPLYRGQPGSLGAATARLWDHADTLSRHCAHTARELGVSSFDGYLAGLLHNTGWMVLFHALQRAGLPDLKGLSLEGVAALEQRAHRLFALAAAGWQITPAFTAFVADARHTTLDRSTDPMACTLRAAQGPCMAELQPA